MPLFALGSLTVLSAFIVGIPHVLPGAVAWGLIRFLRPFRLAAALVVVLCGLLLAGTAWQAAMEEEEHAEAQTASRPAEALPELTREEPAARLVTHFVITGILREPWTPLTILLLVGFMGRYVRAWSS